MANLSAHVREEVRPLILARTLDLSGHVSLAIANGRPDPSCCGLGC
jgi:hypothetical protein